jgi:hypothetical protein
MVVASQLRWDAVNAVCGATPISRTASAAISALG